jgi:ribosome recycling factor
MNTYFMKEMVSVTEKLNTQENFEQMRKEFWEREAKRIREQNRQYWRSVRSNLMQSIKSYFMSPQTTC